MSRIPERPPTLAELDLMKRLKALSEGAATWRQDRHLLGPQERAASAELHGNVNALVDRCLHPLMDRVTSREMQGFTMHDRGHGLKVAHLMWHIIAPARRELLTPSEIALLVIAAHFHDLGMGLSDDERQTRLKSDSDLWDKLDSQSFYFDAIEKLKTLANGTLSASATAEAIYQVQQAQEALLCIDTRERHATRERYQEIIGQLHAMHQDDPINIPNIHTVLSFDGDSFEDKLIDICISHNQDAYALLDRDPTNVDQWRFPTDYPIGCSIADTRLVAAALRLGDILDFDRERTPPVLFHYLLPRSGDPFQNVSIREWAKHLAISNWEIQDGRIIFRARSSSALVHHTIIEFCRTIEEEISSTLSVFGNDERPFLIQPNVQAAIEATGYRYIPYKFSLDEERIYELVLGERVYKDRLDAIRELIQNATDACKLRDALLRCHDQTTIPSNARRIIVSFKESTPEGGSPTLTVSDSGAGMDRYIIENYFLKLGRSYYQSGDFLQTRALLRKHSLDFKPVSEFGIGLASVFMLGDRVEVETASWSADRTDTRKRILRIDGVGRLIEVYEDPNVVLPRFYGTKVSIQLATRSNRKPPTWTEITNYLRGVCRNLPYPLVLTHVTQAGTIESGINPEGLQVPVPIHLNKAALRIPVDDRDNGLDGEIVLFRSREATAAERHLADKTAVRSADRDHETERGGMLLRGGFVIGDVPGLPDFGLSSSPDARIEVSKDRGHPNSLPSTDLARSKLIHESDVASAIFRIWFGALLQSLEAVEKQPIGAPNIDRALLRAADWIQQYSAFDLYRLARTSWVSSFRDVGQADAAIKTWEAGRGKSLWIGATYTRSLHWEVFELVLPTLTELQVEDGHYLLRPIRKGWKEELKNWHTFITKESSWGEFAEYTGSIASFLWDAYSGHRFLNKNYQDRLGRLSPGEATRIRGLLDRLAFHKTIERQTILPSSDVDLLGRVVAAAGDLIVNRFGEQFTVSALARGLC